MTARTVGSLFSGIGGLDLGLERAGWTVKWQAENDPYCSRVLAKHWPAVPNLGDVTKVDWEEVERVELVCGGFPCQPQSYAGKRRGADDERWLWPEFARCLRVLRPRVVLLENVPGLLTLGFGEVAADLADCGYDFEWDCISAAAVGAPHLRYRVWIVAYARRVDSERRGEPRELVGAARTREGETPERQRVRDAIGDRGAALPDSHGGRLQERGEPDRETFGPGLESSRRVDVDGFREDVADTEGESERAGLREDGPGRIGGRRSGDRGGTGTALAYTAATGLERPIFEEVRLRLFAAGRDWWAVEPDVGRVAHGIPARVDRLRGLGNAVVPQVAEWIGAQLLASLSGREP